MTFRSEHAGFSHITPASDGGSVLDCFFLFFSVKSAGVVRLAHGRYRHVEAMRFDLEPTLVNIRGNSRLAGKVAKRTLMFVFGTRPEAIKLAPLILKAKERSSTLRTIVVATAQHRQMLDDVLATFDVKPDVDLNIMAPVQSLFYITAKTFT